MKVKLTEQQFRKIILKEQVIDYTDFGGQPTTHIQKVPMEDIKRLEKFSGIAVEIDDQNQMHEIPYIKGIKNGIENVYIKNGNKVGVSTWKNGKLDGIYQFIGDNGDLRSEKNYKDGKKDGISKMWYPAGKLKYETNYKDGKKDGISKMWYPTGKLMMELNYKNGEKDGVERRWHSAGTPHFAGTWKNGKEDGIWVSWMYGKLSHEATYKDGKIIDEKSYLNFPDEEIPKPKKFY